jgi:hypothetical protein
MGNWNSAKTGDAMGKVYVIHHLGRRDKTIVVVGRRSLPTTTRNHQN